MRGRFITNHVTFKPAYDYKFQLKMSLDMNDRNVQKGLLFSYDLGWHLKIIEMALTFLCLLFCICIFEEKLIFAHVHKGIRQKKIPDSEFKIGYSDEFAKTNQY